MNKLNELGVNLINLYNDSSYVAFDKHFFANRPDMTGYFFIFQDMRDPKFCLILNTSGINYMSNFAKIGDYVYIVFNISSLEEFLENLSEKYMPHILDTIAQNMSKEDTRNLPYGYYYDENGDLKIDIKKAREVREIYDRYMDIQSIRQIANERKTNFSLIRDILHDNEAYMQMQQKILPTTILKTVNGLLAQNVKGTFRKETFSDKLKAVRQRKRKLKSLSPEAQASH